MQTPKTSAKSSGGSEGGGRKIISPRSVSLDSKQTSSSRVVRKLKTSGLEAGSSTNQPIIRTPKTASPKITDRVSPKGNHSELQKKRPGRVSELETQVTQLEDALRTVKDQLIVSELWKKQAKLDAEESRKELLAMTLRLEESEKHLVQSSSDDTHDIQDKHDDEAWKSKSKNNNIQEPNLTDSAALNAALLMIDELKLKLDTITESEATKTQEAESAHEEIHILKEKMAEKLSFMEEMKNQLNDSRSSESRAHAFANETLLQLKTAKKTMESLKLNSDEYNGIVFELDQSRARVRSLESVIQEMKTKEKENESEEIMALRSELGKLKSAKTRSHEEITAELNKSKSDIEELKAGLMDKETELQCIIEENDDLNAKMEYLISGQQADESKQDFNSLNSRLTSVETELREKSDENEKLKLEIKKTNGFMESSKQDFNNLKSKFTSLETELSKKCDENEMLKREIKKMRSSTEAIKRSKDEVAQVTERLAAVKMSNNEMEEELRRLKVQMSQWRKAAEAATEMLCDENCDNNGRMLEDRAWSMGHYSPRKRMNIGSPCTLDIDDDDEFLKRKDGNMLKRIGVLWKKPQNK